MYISQDDVIFALEQRHRKVFECMTAMTINDRRKNKYLLKMNQLAFSLCLTLTHSLYTTKMGLHMSSDWSPFKNFSANQTLKHAS